MLYVHLMQMLNLCGAGRKSWKANFGKPDRDQATVSPPASAAMVAARPRELPQAGMRASKQGRWSQLEYASATT